MARGEGVVEHYTPDLPPCYRYTLTKTRSRSSRMVYSIYIRFENSAVENWDIQRYFLLTMGIHHTNLIVGHAVGRFFFLKVFAWWQTNNSEVQHLEVRPVVAEQQPLIAKRQRFAAAALGEANVRRAELWHSQIIVDLCVHGS